MCTGYLSPTPCDQHVLSGRRSFLKAAGAVALLGATGVLGGTASAAGRAVTGSGLPAAAAARPGERKVALDSISYQLYTARDAMAADAADTLAQLGRLGFSRVEHAGYAGKTRDEFKDGLQAAGLRATSGHTNVPFPYDDASWRRTVQDAAELGQKAIVEPLPLFALPGLVPGAFLGTEPPVSPVPGAVWRAYAQTLNKAGAVAKAYGISLGYHNHNVEFLRVADTITAENAYEILLQDTDPDLVHFEMDLYWVVFSGQDPAEWLRAYDRRFRRFHVKDMAEDGSITAPGTGVIDFKKIFAQAADAGVPIQEYIVEQDNAGARALDSAKRGYELLKAIRF